MKRLLVVLALAGCSKAAAPDAGSGPSPAEALSLLDPRTPLPMLPPMANHQKQNMREHLEAVEAITRALAVDDFEAVEKAAGRIAFSEQMGQMCTRMGEAGPGFTEQALAFHHEADGIITAARAKDSKAVLSALGKTLGHCTSCHATWKQQPVDEFTWQRLTGEPH